MKKMMKTLMVILALLTVFSFNTLATETEPEETTSEPAVTEPVQPEVVVPSAPLKISTGNEGFGFKSIHWDPVEDADGYDVYKKVKGKWVFQSSTTGNSEYVYDLLQNSKYEVSVKSYKIVDGKKYESEEYCEGVIKTSTDIPSSTIKATSTKNGIKLTWDNNDGISGYRLYIRKNSKWVKLKDIYGKDTTSYLYEDVKVGTKYRFGIKTFAKGTEGTKFGSLKTVELVFRDVTKTEITSAKKDSASVTLKWKAVEGAKGYRVFIYKDKKWKAVKTTKSTSYKVTGLEASTKYQFKVRGYAKVKGETKWYPYSDAYSVVTGSKTVKASRIKKLQKSFSDGDWFIKIKNMKDDAGNKFTYSVAGKGDDLFARYDYGKKGVVKYLYLDKKEKVYAIDDSQKKYAVLSDEEAYYMANSMYTVSEIMKVQNVGTVKAKTAYFNGKTAVAETYTDKVYGFKKTYYFVKGKVAGIKIEYKDGSTEEYKYFSVADTPKSSFFKIPSNYKKVS